MNDASPLQLDPIVIEPRFRGFPGYSNGGYAAGRLAALLGAPTVEVTLRAPVPLERELRVAQRAGGGVVLHDRELLLAEARPAPPELGPAPQVSLEQAIAATSSPAADLSRHPAPGCFGCGPGRAPGDGLRLHVGRVAGRDLYAAPFVPSGALPQCDGELLPEVVWAALDCPSGWAAADRSATMHVLGRMTARIERPIRLDARHVVVSWPLAADGRKHHSASALITAVGGVCAAARATWIEPRTP